MGKIQDQTLKGSFFSYLGVALGAITTGFLMPHVLSNSEVGVTKLIVSYSVIFAQIASLGFNSVTTKLFSYFRNYENKHNGFFLIGLIVILSGFLVVYALFLAFQPWLEQFNEKAGLFVRYLEYTIPLTFFTLAFNFIDTYYTQLYNALRGIVLKEFVSRLLAFISIVAYYFTEMDFNLFVVLYVASWSAPGFVLIFKAIYGNVIGLNIPKGFVTPVLKREMFNVSLFGMLLGFSGMAVVNLDSIMLASLLGENATGIYAITFFAGTLVLIPSRPLQKIASAFYADAWKEGNLAKVDEIYRKSSLNQFVIGAFFFLLIWVNIDDLLTALPPEYMAGKYVVFFIGLANWIDMASGANVVIISTSKHYRMLTLFTLILMVLIVVTNYIFIPLFGVSGAAMASMLSTLCFNLMRWGFLFYKYKFQPLRLIFFVPIVLFWVLAFVFEGRILIENPFLNIIAKTCTVSLLFVLPVWWMNVSEELNSIIDKVLVFLKLKS